MPFPLLLYGAAIGAKELIALGAAAAATAAVAVVRDRGGEIVEEAGNFFRAIGDAISPPLVRLPVHEIARHMAERLARLQRGQPVTPVPDASPPTPTPSGAPHPEPIDPTGGVVLALLAGRHLVARGPVDDPDDDPPWWYPDRRQAATNPTLDTLYDADPQSTDVMRQCRAQLRGDARSAWSPSPGSLLEEAFLMMGWELGLLAGEDATSDTPRRFPCPPGKGVAINGIDPELCRLLLGIGEEYAWMIGRNGALDRLRARSIARYVAGARKQHITMALQQMASALLKDAPHTRGMLEDLLRRLHEICR